MFKHLSFIAALSVFSGAVGSPLAAAPTAKPPTAPAVCALTDIVPHALGCSGFFAGNLVGGSTGQIAAQKSGLLAIGYNWDGNYGNIEKIANLGGSHTVNFATLLKGISYVGLHFGGGQGGPGESTAFYKIDGGTGLDIITLAYNASSNAALYATSVGTGGGPIGAVPEPAAWIFMVTGFGVVGATLRRKRAVVAA